VPMAATTAVEISGPMPGMLMRRWQFGEDRTCRSLNPF
jgi:hypothetical protein